MKKGYVILVLLLVAILPLAVKAQQMQPRPNILLIMADDMSRMDMEPYGSKQVYTPHLQQLASEGVCFDNMYNMVPICAPTRQSLLTGLGPVRNGAYPNHSEIYEGIRTLPVYMKALGYKVGLIGKKHYGPLPSYPFDFLGGRDQDNGKGQDVDLSKAEAYIKSVANQPFMLVFTSNQPHSPWNRGNPQRYDPQQLQLGENMLDTRLTRIQMAKYFAEITYLDSLVGYCLDMIDRLGQRENTLVIFTSEQGNSFPFSKWTLYDQGLRSGFIVRWPGVVQPGTRNAAMVQYTDVLPTLIEIAGGAPAQLNTGSIDGLGKTGFDGTSFLQVLQGRSQHHRKYVFGVNTTRGIINGSEAYASRSVRNDRYLYIANLNPDNAFSNVVTDSKMFQQWMQKDPARASLYVKRPAVELYDIVKDPWQLHNLAGNPSTQKTQALLKQQLTAFMLQQKDEGVKTEMRAFSRQHKKRKTE